MSGWLYCLQHNEVSNQAAMTMKIDREVNDMCNLSLGLWEEAMNEGRLEGERMGKLGNLRDMILDGLTTMNKLRATGRYTEEELSFVADSLKP